MILSKFLNGLSLIVIKLYKFFLSPFLRPRCRFYPSCSTYARECFKEFTFPVALWYATVRILKCNPMHTGGVDLAPSKRT